MKVHEFYNTVSGPRSLSISECDTPLCPYDFWRKYRRAPEWTATIDHVKFIPHDDKVICLIKICN